MSKDPKRYLVTAALPYANGPVHIGHLAGCYLPADIYARYLRAQKKDVKFVCGSDEHGVPITIRSSKTVLNKWGSRLIFTREHPMRFTIKLPVIFLPIYMIRVCSRRRRR